MTPRRRAGVALLALSTAPAALILALTFYAWCAHTIHKEIR